MKRDYSRPRGSSLNMRRIITRSKKTLQADFPEVKVVFDLETYTPYTLNQTAALLWDFLKRPRESNKIIDFLQNRYKISLDRATQDAGKFILALKKKGLVQIRVIPD